MNIYTIKFLIKLKNAALARKEIVFTSYNKLSFELVKCLYKEGFIQSFELKEIFTSNSEKKYEIKIVLRFFYNKCVLKNIKILSKPSLTKHFSLKDLSKISSKKLVMFISTDKGILTSLDCKKYNLGGIPLFVC
jgi:small subunit ribosomal protein S8